MTRALTLLAALLVPMTAFAADRTTAAADQPAIEEHDAPARPSRSAGEVIDDAKDATNAAIEAAKEAILKAIEEAKENTSTKLEQGKKESEKALDKAKDATSLLDKAAEAARDVLDKAKQATSEVFDKAKEAANELKQSQKSTEASPTPDDDTAPNEKGPRETREPQSDSQKWH
jgi:hypothetical protein